MCRTSGTAKRCLSEEPLDPASDPGAVVGLLEGEDRLIGLLVGKPRPAPVLDQGAEHGGIVAELIDRPGRRAGFEDAPPQ